MKTLPAHYSSSRHVGCGGILDRTIEHYDIAPCLSCHRLVKTHYNAALFLDALHLQSKIEDATEKTLPWKFNRKLRKKDFLEL